MNELYRYIGYTKQSFHQKMDRELQEHESESLLIPIIRQLREEHPGVAARQLYHILKPQGVGRDKFEKLCFENGFKLQRQKSAIRTTDSSGVIRFPNLTAGREFTAFNQAWSSDITYYQIREETYYLTFIMDLFSRLIVGYHVSERLLTIQTTLPALIMALDARKPDAGLIFHSDGGGQYYCKEFLELTRTHHLKNSMCDIVFENAHAERINGTIKNQYLKGYNPINLLSLKRMTAKAVYNYNYIRPHQSLNNLSPADFEKKYSAEGSSLVNDNFWNFGNKSKHNPEKLSFTNEVDKRKQNNNRVEKTVNVF